MEHIKKEAIDALIAVGKFLTLPPERVYVHPDDMPLFELEGVAEGAIPCKSVRRGTVMVLRENQ